MTKKKIKKGKKLVESLINKLKKDEIFLEKGLMFTNLKYDNEDPFVIFHGEPEYLAKLLLGSFTSREIGSKVFLELMDLIIKNQDEIKKEVLENLQGNHEAFLNNLFLNINILKGKNNTYIN